MSKNLYQKYRPNNFDEIIGQNDVVNILKKSISNNKVQNAYLFNGPRGTGKTSIAKIFSRAINCDDLDNPLKDNCSYCQYFEKEKEYSDIFELDAASNNGVDDIRSIIEHVYFQPIKLKKKIYIIDEVHMLSKGAFNALLKTLEEPPEYVVFILATTEPNKIPPTILSRCQRFDFSRIDNTIMNQHLNKIIEKEGLTIENQNDIQIISELSDGCVRDALSLLQKVIIGEKEINKEMIESKLGLINKDNYQKILNLILNQKEKELLLFWNELYLSGINVERFIIDFQFYIKNELLKNKFTKEEEKKIFDIILIVNDIEQRAVYTNNLNNLIEIMFLKSCRINYSEKITVPTEEVKIIKKEIKEEIPVKVTKSKPKPVPNINNTYDNIASDSTNDLNYIATHLTNAIKETRIEYINKFKNISDDLLNNKKRGLAKFFIEGDIKAANDEIIIVCVNEILINSYQERKKEIEEQLNFEKEIIIITNNEWNKIKIIYMENKTKINNIPQKEEISETNQKLINNLNEKLNTKIKVIEE